MNYSSDLTSVLNFIVFMVYLISIVGTTGVALFNVNKLLWNLIVQHCATMLSAWYLQIVVTVLSYPGVILVTTTDILVAESYNKMTLPLMAPSMNFPWVFYELLLPGLYKQDDFAVDGAIYELTVVFLWTTTSWSIQQVWYI